MSTSEALDVAWILIAAALVMLMQAGFSSLESGSVRTKNSINVAAKNFADFCVSSAIFWVFGFALMFGITSGGVLGTSGFLFGKTSDPWLMAFFIFQLGFAGTAVTIVSGAVAERMRFASYLVITLVVASLIYPVFGHWAWASSAGGPEGWLESIGFIDFAGSTVVHSVGGWMALAAVLVIGPRIGRFGKGSVRIHGHDLPMVTLGVFLLWFGWFGFNGGSTLALTAEVPAIIVNTTISGAFGGLVALLLSWRVTGQPDVPTTMNGALAGLVGITASANIVTTGDAVIIGSISGAVMYAAAVSLERLGVDDAVGAVPVHLFAGIWGTIAVALFGDLAAFDPGTTRWEQLGVQLLGIGVCCAWAFGLGLLLLRLINRRFPLRIDPEGERIGLNVAEHGASTEILDLLTEMDTQRRRNDFSSPVTVEPHTEVGQIAQQYNRVLEDITAETRRREAAAVSLKERTALLQLLQTTTAAANESLTIEEALASAVENVCAHTGWPIGHVYIVDEDAAGRLVSADIWQLGDPGRFEPFRRATDGTSFGVGEGLPGRCLASKRPERLSVQTADLSHPRAKVASELGIESGFAFPVLAGREVAAVLEFFSEAGDELDEPTLDVMAAVGTQLGRAVERRRSEEERFRTVVDNMPAIVMLRDLQGRLLIVNRQYEEFYLARDEDLRGKRLDEVHWGAQVSWDLEGNMRQDREVIEKNRVVEQELHVTRKGREHILAAVKFPITDHAGDIVAVGGIELDITDRKQHEAELAALVEKVKVARDQAMRATQAKSQFLANMSHELRTPLNAIVGFARLVRKRSSDILPPRQQENLDKILVSAEHLMSLINEILDLSRIEAGRVDVFPSNIVVGALIDLCVSTVEPLAADKQIGLVKRIEPGLPVLLTDEEKLKQILINLLGNAVKFTEQGTVTVSARSRDGGILFNVEDTGVGIREDDLERIFEEFHQVEGGSASRAGGTGLGLSISRQLARLLGGDISVRSELGVGSTFTVRIPHRYRPLGHDDRDRPQLGDGGTVTE